ncbi:MAG: lytic transglycosylase domain-containing protein [Thermoanaerobaculales bacterium]
MNKACIVLSCVALLASATGAVAGGVSGETAGRSGTPGDPDLRRIVTDVSREHGVDPKLVDALVRVESGYDPKAVSRRGAMGLMQLMPDTARRLEVDDPFDPEDNVRGGVREFSRLVDRYSGNLQLALAAYNAGEGAVARHRGIPPFPETQSYVAQVLALYTGKPYRLAGSYRVIPVRMLKGPGGRTVITNVGPSSSSYAVHRSAGGDGPLRGGFGSK